MALSDLLKKLFGNKSQRDMRDILPYVETIKATYETIKPLSNDELRNKIDEVKQEIQDAVASEKERIA